MAADSKGEGRKTPLYDAHRALGARFVSFAGYDMPVQYESLIEEHRAVRSAAGLFDVSHMGEFEVRGADAARLLDSLTPSRVMGLEPGKALYTGLTNDEGAFVDDLLIYRFDEERYVAVVNASNREKDLAWIVDRAGSYDAVVEDVSDDTALLALQGPRAKKILAPIAEGFDALKLKYYRLAAGRIAGRDVVASRTGYTGEIGFEIFTKSEDAPDVWNAILEAGGEQGLRAAGLGARDTLRLEAGLPLYGNDIDEETDVLTAGLGFIVDWEKDAFVGRDALHALRESGTEKTRVGFRIEGRGIARSGDTIALEGGGAGRVASGSWSPTLEQAIGMGYCPSPGLEPGARFEIESRSRRLPAEVVPIPFYRRPKPAKRKA